MQVRWHFQEGPPNGGTPFSILFHGSFPEISSFLHATNLLVAYCGTNDPLGVSWSPDDPVDPVGSFSRPIASQMMNLLKANVATKYDSLRSCRSDIHMFLFPVKFAIYLAMFVFFVSHPFWETSPSCLKYLKINLAMDQYLLIPFLVGWTSIYQLFWCSPGVQGFDTLPFGSLDLSRFFWSFGRRCDPQRDRAFRGRERPEREGQIGQVVGATQLPLNAPLQKRGVFGSRKGWNFGYGCAIFTTCL